MYFTERFHVPEDFMIHISCISCKCSILPFHYKIQELDFPRIYLLKIT